MSRAARQVDFHGRVLAEAARCYEQDQSAGLDDAQAVDAARTAGGDVETRIINRARHLDVASSLRRALRQLNAVIGWTVALALMLALLAGAATARATLGVDGRGVANFFWTLGGVLGVQSVALLLWLLAMGVTIWLGRRADAAAQPPAAISLGSVTFGAARWLVHKVHPDAPQTAAVEAAGRVHASGSLGRWTFSSITHSLWLAFNVGCLAMIIVLLSARQYTFVWETTILTERHYVQLTQAVAAVPEALGFAAPSEQQIAASQRRDGVPLPENAREAWSSLLVGSIVVYGFAPRLLLLGLSLSRRRVARKRFRLDLTQPAYARLEHRVADRPRHIKAPYDGEAGEPTMPAVEAMPHRERPSGPPAIVGIEITPPQSTWPPLAPGLQWDDLGLLENRDDQRQAIEYLQSSPAEPSRLAIVCDLTNTPDRGIARLVRQLREPLTREPLILLTGGHALRTRGYDADRVTQRVADWRQLATQAGLAEDDVIELDLDSLTDSSVHRLAQLVSGNGQQQPQAGDRRIEQAFQQIVKHVETWRARGQSADDTAAQAELHRAIAQVYRNDAHAWRDFLRVPRSIEGGDMAATLKAGADRVVQLLPARLVSSPKWLAAGAMSGALGCIAAATLLSPVAIAALPTWSIIGAAVAAVLQPRSKHEPREEDAVNYAEPVRAAMLFALLLELQGRDEAAITRTLDRVLDDDEAVIANADDAKRLLDQTRHRLDVALAEANS